MTLHRPPDILYDAIIIGSGFGGAMAARPLIDAGLKVLMIERGDWVRRGPENWDVNAAYHLSPYHSMDSPIRVEAGGHFDRMGNLECVGGPSVFYGGVSLRYREADFTPPAEIVADSGAAWPIDYRDLEPHYTVAERLLHVHGASGVDPTEPPRSCGYPAPPGPIAEVSRTIAAAANALGMHPVQLPLAINHSAREANRGKCISCPTCDTYACAIGAKNDIAIRLIPDLLTDGMVLARRMVVRRLVAGTRRIEAVECVDKSDGATLRFRGRQVILAAGALGTPHIVLSSGLAERNPGGQLIGRFLMRHTNAIVFGIFPRVPDRQRRFHKDLGIFDFYFGDPDNSRAPRKLGCIQQFQTPPVGLVRDFLPWPLGTIIAPTLSHLTGLLTISEDQPQLTNHVRIDPGNRDRFGLSRLIVHHRYTARDMAAARALIRRSRQILRKAGAWLHYVHWVKTFSHALGTMRMGDDPTRSVVDGCGAFRGLDNLFVTDGSVMPTSAGVNPSLTIAANALRISNYLVRTWRDRHEAA